MKSLAQKQRLVLQSQPLRAGRIHPQPTPSIPPSHPVLRLQTTIGNQAVQGVIQAGGVVAKLAAVKWWERSTATKARNLSGLQYSPFQVQRQPQFDQQDKIPGKDTWAKPDFADKFDMSANEFELLDKIRERDFLRILVGVLQQVRQHAIDVQKAARAKLNDIRKHDIWPNWETLNHVLTVAGTLVGCYEGACLVSLATGIAGFLDTDSGSALSVAASCATGLRKPGCAAAVVGGAGSVVADRKDRKAKASRMSEKEMATQILEGARQAQKIIEDRLAKLKKMQDEVDDSILFHKKVYEYARWGRPEDHPYYQHYKVSAPI